jgi:putative ABC transport system substrate-binding protein
MISSLLLFHLAQAQPANKPLTVAVLVPMELPAMDEIVAGFKQELSSKYHGQVKFIVKNSQGDVNLQRTILQQFNDPNIDIVAPIGTRAMEMAMTLIKDKPIVAIDADWDPSYLTKANNKNVTDVIEGVEPSDQIAFIHYALPNLKKMTFVHSMDQRIFVDAKKVKAAAAKNNIQLQEIGIDRVSDIYSISRSIDQNSQAIFALEDEIVVSGVNALVNQAERRPIPVITSDEGSVQKGSAFALGVSQRQIGMSSADMVLKVLAKGAAEGIPVEKVSQFTLYINKAAAAKQGIKVDQIVAAAHHFNYPIQFLS